MSHKRLRTLISTHEAALLDESELNPTLEAIIGLLKALDAEEFTERQALRLLGYQARRVSCEPTRAALYRQTAAALQQMQREEH